MADTCQARGRRKDTTTSSAHLGSNITIIERSTSTILSKKGLREKSLSDCRFFTEDVQLVQDNVLSSAYSIDGFRTL